LKCSEAKEKEDEKNNKKKNFESLLKIINHLVLFLLFFSMVISNLGIWLVMQRYRN
jgi:hypothetical protein